MKPSCIFIALSVFLLNCKAPVKTTSNDDSNLLRCDSLFKTSFLNIRKTLDKKTGLTKEEQSFIYLTSYLSGIEIHMDSGYLGNIDFNEKKLMIFEAWYARYGSKIQWNKIQMGLNVLNSESFTDKQLKELKGLRIE